MVTRGTVSQSWTRVPSLVDGSRCFLWGPPGGGSELAARLQHWRFGTFKQKPPLMRRQRAQHNMKRMKGKEARVRPAVATRG